MEEALSQDEWDWDLYQTEQGNTPKDLLEHFITLIRKDHLDRIPEHPPQSKIDDIEAERLRRGIKFLLDQGPRAISKPRFDSFGDNIHELRSVGTHHNPRWLFTYYSDDRLFTFLHAFAKKNNGRTQAKDLGPAQQRKKDLDRRRTQAQAAQPVQKPAPKTAPKPDSKSGQKRKGKDRRK